MYEQIQSEASFKLFSGGSTLFIFRLHKLGIEAHAYAHYTSLLCFVVGGLSYTPWRYNIL